MLLRFVPCVLLASCLVAQSSPVGKVTLEQKVSTAIARISPTSIEKTVRDLVAFDTRHVLSATDDKMRGTGAARAYLEARYRALISRSGGRLSVERKEYDVPCRRRGMPKTVKVVNIVATLKGVSDPDRIYIVGGHYDSRNSSGGDGEGVAPGANDDGSGTAVALEACVAMCQSEFAATLVFVAYDGEEQGLLGATAHAKELAAAGAFVDGMITNDIVGNTLGMDGVRRRGYLRCFSYAPTGNDSKGRSLARAGHRAARRVPDFDLKLVFRGDRYGRGGDHKPFFSAGFPSIRLTEPREDYSRQHQNMTTRDGKPYGDLPDFMDFAYTAQVTAVNVSLLAELASAPRPPAQPRASGSRSSYDTVMNWSPSAEGTTYEAVWRDTTAATWTGVRVLAAGALSEQRGRIKVALKGVCLDDAVVGLRTVAADGSRSRVVTPPEPDAFSNRRR